MRRENIGPASPPEKVRLELLPQGKTLEVERGTPLQDVLFAHGVEFPCGGHGRCKGCRVKVVGSPLRVTSEDSQKLSAVELSQGWRLSCRAVAERDLAIELAQWEAPILTDTTAFEFTPQDGFGVAVDLGTTTIVAQLVDLRTGQVLGVSTALNMQAQHGADIMSRVEFAMSEGGQQILQESIRAQIGEMIHGLWKTGPNCAEHALGSIAAGKLRSVVLVGNTVMHHLFGGLSVAPLSQYPFEPVAAGVQRFSAAELRWEQIPEASVCFLPCLGGFVGSDILAGIMATKLDRSDTPAVLLDLGTNGEIVVGNGQGMLCASTAAGPAFEGARISTGMRAATGAISEVTVQEGKLHCHVLGRGVPKGICGSGLVDAVAAGLELGLIRHTGRLSNGESLALSPPVALNQWDIRELQLAKGAIAAGLRILLNQYGASVDDLSAVYVAGAFGNYINHRSAQRIGLFNVPPAKVRAVGNTALLGAKIALFGLDLHHGLCSEVLRKVKHVPLKEDPSFQEAFVEEMSFPSQ